MSNIHYSEGEFPLNIYGPGYCYHRDGYTFGLYSGAQWAGKPCCPTTCTPVEILITDVAVEVQKIIKISITYSDGTVETTTVEIGKQYVVKYIADGKVNQVTGTVTGVEALATVADCPCCVSEYLIRLDCSTVGNSKVLTIRTSMIRGIQEYKENIGESTSISAGTTYGATLYGSVNNIIITDATVDGDGNVTKGTIVSANLAENAVALGGCSMGINSNGVNVVVAGGITKGGIATEGSIISARVYTPIVTGGTPSNGVIVGATVKGTDARIVAMDCTISSGTISEGSILDAKIENSVVVGGSRSGEDMVTTGAAIFGTKGYGGTSTGGTLYGGEASGTINGLPFTIYNGETTGGYTMKAVVEGGIIQGGSHVGQSVVGAVIMGGTATDGTTTGGTTVLGSTGYIKPGFNAIPEGLVSPVNDINTFKKKDIDDLIIWWKYNTLYSTLGTWNPKQ